MNKIVLLLLCFFLPPIAVFFMKGVSKELVISIILAFFFYVPSQLYAFYLALK